MNNIILIGFMGAGKSTVGKILSSQLNRELIEMDDHIIQLSGLKSVNEIFEKKGEKYFRLLEKKVTLNCSKMNNVIISCGGGIVTNPENMRLLKRENTVFLLKASFKTIKERLKKEDIRPLFMNKETAALLFRLRAPLYKQYADEEIKTDNLSPDEVSLLILPKINSENAH
jgi:shikimate kinase